MKHIPAHCPKMIQNVRNGDQLAGCDFKALYYVGADTFLVSYYQAGMHIRGFSEAREKYNNLPMLTPEQLAE